MRSCLITNFLLLLAFNEVTAHVYVTEIGKAIEAELNSTCVEQYGYNASDAGNYMNTCIDQLEPSRPRDAVCNGTKIPECVKNFEENILISCLPKHFLDVAKQTFEVLNQYFEIGCATALEDAFFKCGGDLDVQIRHAMTECLDKFGSSKPYHLEDMFSTKNCNEYRNLYECFNAISNDCPVVIKGLTNLIRPFVEAALCNEMS